MTLKEAEDKLKYIDNKHLLIRFYFWLLKTSEKEPMRLETDADDIVAMFLESIKE